MDPVLRELNFLQKLSTASLDEARALLKHATDSERQAVISYISLREDLHEHSPVIQHTGFFQKTKFYFRRKYVKYIAPVAACLLIKIIQECFVYIWDNATL